MLDLQHLKDQVANEESPAIPQFVISRYDHDRAIADLRHRHELQGVEPPPVEPREETLIARVGAFSVRPQVRASYFAAIADSDWPRIKGYTAATPWPEAMTLLTVGPVDGSGGGDAATARESTPRSPNGVAAPAAGSRRSRARRSSSSAAPSAGTSAAGVAVPAVRRSDCAAPRVRPTRSACRSSSCRSRAACSGPPAWR